MKKIKIVLTALLMVLTIAGVSAKNAHAAGEVAAWGNNGYGQLGDGTSRDTTTPVQVIGLTDSAVVAGGGFHSLALKNDGTVWAWGANYSGQLGDGTWDRKSTPVQVVGLAGITAIAGGWGHSLALKNDGTVWAWGWNAYGELGDGTWDSKSTPVQVVGLTGITAIAGGYGHSLAIKNDGTVWAWGFNGYGELGDGTTNWNGNSIPVQVLGLRDITAIAGGAYHSLAIGQIADTTPPVITINSPIVKDYLISDVLTIDFAVTDSQSGVKSFSASLDGQSVQGGQSINLYTLALGSHTLTVNAEDNAGNKAVKSVTFNIIVTQSSLISLIQYFLSQGLIANQGIANSMIQKIQNGAIGAFLNFLNAQDGKQIDSTAAAILRAAAGAL